MNNYKKGHLAEKFAAIFLMFKGYRIIALNYITGKATGAGEIDIIAAKKNMLIFIEIKLRKNLTEAAYSITQNQKNRITTAAKSFISHHKKYRNYDIRFDAILIQNCFQFEHIKNAF